MARTKKKLQDEQRLELERCLYGRGRGGRGRGRGRGRPSAHHSHWHGRVSPNSTEPSSQNSSSIGSENEIVPSCSLATSPVLTSEQSNSISTSIVPSLSRLGNLEMAKDSTALTPVTPGLVEPLVAGMSHCEGERAPVERHSSPRRLSPVSSVRNESDKPDEKLLESPVSTSSANSRTARKSTGGGKRKKLLYELIGAEGITPVGFGVVSGEMTTSGRSTPQECSTSFTGPKDRGNIFDKLLTGLTDESSMSESDVCGEESPVGRRKNKRTVIVFNTVGQAVQNMGLRHGKIPLVCMKDVLKVERDGLVGASSPDNSMQKTFIDLKHQSSHQTGSVQKSQQVSRQSFLTSATCSAIAETAHMIGTSKTAEAQKRTPGIVSSLVCKEKMSTATLMSSCDSLLNSVPDQASQPHGHAGTSLLSTSPSRFEKRKRSPNVRLGSDMILLPWHSTRRPRDKPIGQNPSPLSGKTHSSSASPRKPTTETGSLIAKCGDTSKTENHPDKNRSCGKITLKAKLSLGLAKEAVQCDETKLSKYCEDNQCKESKASGGAILKSYSTEHLTCVEKPLSSVSEKQSLISVVETVREQIPSNAKKYKQGQPIEGQHAMFRMSPTASPRKCKIVAVIKSEGLPSTCIRDQRLISPPRAVFPPNAVLSPDKGADSTPSPSIGTAKRKIVFVLGKDALSFDHAGAGDGAGDTSENEKSREHKPEISAEDNSMNEDNAGSTRKTVQAYHAESLEPSDEKKQGNTSAGHSMGDPKLLKTDRKDVDVQRIIPSFEANCAEGVGGCGTVQVEKAKHCGLSHLIARMTERVTHSPSPLDVFSEVLRPEPLEESGESSSGNISPIASPPKAPDFITLSASCSSLNTDCSNKSNSNVSQLPPSASSEMSLDNQEVEGESSSCLISESLELETKDKVELAKLSDQTTRREENDLPMPLCISSGNKTPSPPAEHRMAKARTTKSGNSPRLQESKEDISSCPKSFEMSSVAEEISSQGEIKGFPQEDTGNSANDTLSESVQEGVAGNANTGDCTGSALWNIKFTDLENKGDGIKISSDEATPEGLRYGQRTREPAPLSVFSKVEQVIPEKVLSAFMSEDLDSYLQSNENREIKLVSEALIKTSRKKEIQDGLKLNKIRRRKRKRLKAEHNAENQTEKKAPCEKRFSIDPAQPDFDDVDGLLFVSFPSKEAMAAHIRIERQRHWDDNNFHFLDMSKLQALDRLMKKYGVTTKEKLPKYLRHKEKSFQGLHMKWRKYSRLYKRELDKVAKAQQIRSEGMPSNVSRVLEKTSDITKIKGWKNKYFEQTEPNDGLSEEINLQDSGKLHWRTEQRLLKALKPEDIKEMGLELKKKRRNRMIFTHRKMGAKIEGRVGRSGRLSRPVANQEDDYYYGDEDQYYKDVLEEDESPRTDRTFKKKISLKKKLMRKYNLCGLKKLKKMWRRRLREGKAADGEREEKDEISDMVDDPQVLTQRMAIRAVSALDFDVFGGSSRKCSTDRLTEGQRQDPKLNKDPAGSCDKPGCRYGCVCHLFRDRAVPGSKGSDSEESPQESLNQPCEKEYCRLGCICSSLDGQIKEKSLEHCGKMECMLECHCVSGSAATSAGNKLNLSGTSGSGQGSADDIPTLLAETELSVPSQAEDPLKSPDASILSPSFPTPEISPPKESSPIKRSTPITRGGMQKYANLPRRVGSQRVAKNLDAVTRKAMLYMDPDDLFPKPKRQRKRKLSADNDLNRTIVEETLTKISSHISTVKKAPKPVTQLSSISKRIVKPLHITTREKSTLVVKKVRTLSIDVGLDDSQWHNEDEDDDDIDSPDCDYNSCARTSAFNPVRRAAHKAKSLPENMELPQPEVYMDCFEEDSQESMGQFGQQETVEITGPSGSNSSQDQPEIECLTPIIQKDDKKRKRKQRLERTRSDFPENLPEKKNIKKSEMKASKPVSLVPISLHEPSSKGPKVNPFWSTHMVCLKPIQRTKSTDERGVVGEQASLPKCDQHLLDIKSNCDWEKKRNSILSKISQCLTPSIYPTPQQLIVDDFTVEILPKSDKPACIPPNLQCQLPATMFSIKVKVTPTWYEAKVARNYDLKKEAVAKKAAGKVLTASEHLKLRKQKLAEVRNAVDVAKVLKPVGSFNERKTTANLQAVAAKLDKTVTDNNDDVPSWLQTTGISGLSRLKINKSLPSATGVSPSESHGLHSSMEKFRLREGHVLYNSVESASTVNRHSPELVETVDLVADEDKPQTYIDLTESDDPQFLDSPTSLTSKVLQATSFKGETTLAATSTKLTMVSSTETPVPVGITRNLATSSSTNSTKAPVSVLPVTSQNIISRDKASLGGLLTYPDHFLETDTASIRPSNSEPVSKQSSGFQSSSNSSQQTKNTDHYTLSNQSSQGNVVTLSAPQLSSAVQSTCKMSSVSNAVASNLISPRTGQGISALSKFSTVPSNPGHFLSKAGNVTLQYLDSATNVRSVSSSVSSNTSTPAPGVTSSSMGSVPVRSHPIIIASGTNTIRPVTSLPAPAPSLNRGSGLHMPPAGKAPPTPNMTQLPRMQLIRGSDGQYSKLVPLTPGKIGNMSLVQIVPLPTPPPGAALLTGKGKATDLVAIPVVLQPVNAGANGNQKDKSVPPTPTFSKLPSDMVTMTNASRLSNATTCIIPQHGPRLMPVNGGTQSGGTVILRQMTPVSVQAPVQVAADPTAVGAFQKAKEQIKPLSQGGRKKESLSSLSSSTVANNLVDCSTPVIPVVESHDNQNCSPDDLQSGRDLTTDGTTPVQALSNILAITTQSGEQNDTRFETDNKQYKSTATKMAVSSHCLQSTNASQINVNNSNAKQTLVYGAVEDHNASDTPNVEAPKLDPFTFPSKVLSLTSQIESSEELGQHPSELMGADSGVVTSIAELSTVIDGTTEQTSQDHSSLKDISLDPILPTHGSAPAIVQSSQDPLGVTLKGLDAIEATLGHTDVTIGDQVSALTHINSVSDVAEKLLSVEDSIDLPTVDSLSDPVDCAIDQSVPNCLSDPIDSTNSINSVLCPAGSADDQEDLTVDSTEDTPTRVGSPLAKSSPGASEKQAELPLPPADIMPDHSYPVSVTEEPLEKDNSEDNTQNAESNPLSVSHDQTENSATADQDPDKLVKLSKLAIPGASDRINLKRSFVMEDGITSGEPAAKVACLNEPYSDPASGTQTPDRVSLGADSQNSLDSWSDLSEDVDLPTSDSQSAAFDESDVDIEGISDDDLDVSAVSSATECAGESSRNKRKSPVQAKPSTTMDIEFTEELLLVDNVGIRSVMGQALHNTRERQRRTVMKQSFSHLSKLIFSQKERQGVSVISKQQILTRTLKFLAKLETAEPILISSLERERTRNNSLQQQLRLLSAGRTGELSGYQTAATCLKKIARKSEKQLNRRVQINDGVPQFIPIPDQVKPANTGKKYFEKISRMEERKNVVGGSKLEEVIDTVQVSDTDEMNLAEKVSDTEGVNNVEEVSNTEGNNSEVRRHTVMVNDADEVNTIQEGREPGVVNALDVSDADEMNNVEEVVDSEAMNFEEKVNKSKEVSDSVEVNNAEEVEDTEEINEHGGEPKQQNIDETDDPNLVASLTLGDGSSVKILVSDDSCVLLESDTEESDGEIQVCSVKKNEPLVSPSPKARTPDKTGQINKVPVTSEGIDVSHKTRSADKTDQLSAVNSDHIIVASDTMTPSGTGSVSNQVPAVNSDPMIILGKKDTGLIEDGETNSSICEQHPVIDISGEESGILVIQPGGTLVIHAPERDQDNSLLIGNVCSLANWS